LTNDDPPKEKRKAQDTISNLARTTDVDDFESVEKVVVSQQQKTAERSKGAVEEYQIHPG